MLQRIGWGKPVNVQVIMANPDPAGGVRRSNSVAVDFGQ